MAQAPRESKESRRRVLDAALRLFSERGYGGTSLQAIADQLGVTKASVYYHFPAKADLLSAAADPWLARLQSILDDPPDPTGRNGRRALLEAYLHTLVESTVWGLLIGDRTAAAHPASRRCRDQRHRMRDLLAAMGSPRSGRVRAACSLGAVQSVLDFADTASARHRATVLDAAMSALGAGDSGA